MIALDLAIICESLERATRGHVRWSPHGRMPVERLTKERSNFVIDESSEVERRRAPPISQAQIPGRPPPSAVTEPAADHLERVPGLGGLVGGGWGFG
eukprot:9123686-Pyramimonas_sp.AAC.1